MSDLQLAEKKLVAELAVAVSFFMQTESEPSDEPGYFYHMFQGPFDEICHIVWELGGARVPAESSAEGLTYRAWLKRTPQSDVGPAVFRFMEPEEIRANIMAREGIEQSLMLRLLEAYLRSMVDYGRRGAYLKIDRMSFIPGSIFAPQIDALVECGFMRRVGLSVQWTDKIAPLMQAAGFWDELLDPVVSPSIVVTKDVQAEVETLVKSGNRLAAIDAVRKGANCGLLEAKQYLHDLERLLA